MAVRTIGVIGSGTMGHGIAQVFAQAGFDVRLHDAVPAAIERGRAAIEKSLAKFVEKGKLSAGARDATLARIQSASKLDAFSDVDYVVEAVVENLQVKRGLFVALDAVTRPDAILMSNTSSISITTLGATTTTRQGVGDTHFMNPVPLMALVELVQRSGHFGRFDGGSDRSLCRALGKTPVVKRPTIQVSLRIAS